jgi:SAM-dependent methyltransferase
METLTTEIPPDDLLFLVSNHSNRELWGASRRAAVVNVILPLIEQAGFTTRMHILDFGCGCGRILAGWEGLLNGATLDGADINPRLIDFCKTNVNFARVAQSGICPPLPYKDASFDLVYAASVFTHMKFVTLLQWAGEMARIIMPGGALMLSFHGTYYEPIIKGYGPDALRKLNEKGYYVHIYGKEDETFEGSNAYATYLSIDFIGSLFKGFELKTVRRAADKGPTHFGAHQDIAIFKRLDD